MVINKNTLKYIFCGVVFIIIFQLALNPIGARYPFQDLMINDHWAITNLNFFDNYFKNFGSVINFSEGFGIDIRINIKSQLNFFDPALFFSLFLSNFVAAQIKIILLHITGFIFFYLLLRSYSKNNHLLLAFSLIFISSLQYISETSTLTTSNYLLILPFVYFFKKIVNYNLKNSVLIVTIIFILVGNADLNIIFIMPLVFVWSSEFQIKKLLSKKYFLTYFIFFITIIVSKYNYNIFNFNEYLPEITSNNLENTSLAQSLNFIEYVIKSLLFPKIVGPITLFIYSPVVFILLFNLLNKKIIPLYVVIFLSIFFYIVPFLILSLKEYTPSFVRYHFCVTSIIIYYYSCKIILTEKLPSRYYFSYFVSVFLISAYLIYKGEILSYSLLSTIFIILFSINLYSIIIKKNSFLNLLILPFFIFGFYYTGMKGGFNYSASRVIDRDFAKAYNIDLNQCIKDNVDLSGIVLTAYNPLFENNGRHDLIVPIIEQPSENLGRTFFQWRHSYPTITSKLYQSSGAIGSTFNKVNFFPPSLRAIESHGFWSFVKFSKANNLITINHTIEDDNNLTFIKNCKIRNKVKVNKKSDNSKQESFDTFFNDVNIYRINWKNKVQFIFNTHNFEIIIPKGEAVKNKEIKTPVIFWPSVFVENNEYFKIIKSNDGFISIIPQKNFGEEISFSIGSRDWSIFSPIYLYIFILILLFFIRNRLN
jgi:hypothetical protein